MPRRPSRSAQRVSPLRQARLARNWTLERLAEEIDLRTPGGHSGVTPSMVSGWELGRHITSIGHRRTLCDIYGQPPDALFAHQDQSLTAGAALQLLAGFGDLRQAMLATVAGARGDRADAGAPGAPPHRLARRLHLMARHVAR
jgi:transcriptional regulator with XRE-family HTH domain